MTPIGSVLNRAMDTVREPAPPPTARVVPLTPVARPQLSPELRARVQAAQAGPDRYGALNEHDPGFRLASQVGVAFHPDAEPAATQLRAARERPMELADIERWLKPIAGMVSNPPPDRERARAFATGLAMSECGRFPAVVWEDALSEALTAFSLWPSGKELKDLLAQYDARQLAEIRALEVVANGRKGPAPEPGRKSTEVYRPRAYLSEQRERRLSEPLFDDDPDEIQKQDAEARAGAVAQLARLGLVPEPVPPLPKREAEQ
jgi:hypothetical protein